MPAPGAPALSDAQRQFAKLVLCLAPLAATARSVSAQSPTIARAGPGTIVGIVNDSLGGPLDSADVFIASEKKHVAASANGVFRFDKLKAGSYQVAARRFGYFPQVIEVTVGDSGGVAVFALVPNLHPLPTVITSAVRGGLSGVVGDSSYNIIEGAEVFVLATEHHAVTDSMGAFFLPVKPGRYMVRVKFPGYASRLLSVTIPTDSGRRILVGLAPQTRPPLAREEAAIFELGMRLSRRSVLSKIYTREDINHMGMTDLQQIATMGAVQRVDESCQAQIDGGPVTMPIWLISAADIESVEIYPETAAERRARTVPRSIYGHQQIRSQGVNRNTDCPVTVIVWMRK